MSGTKRTPEEIVRDGWDRASFAYRPEGAVRDPFGHFEGYREWLALLFEELAPGSRVLGLGCGCGVPASAMLAERFHVTGVDLSEVQILRARQLVPNATFLREDMTRVIFEPVSFHAVIGLYSLIHVPLRKQRPLLGRVRSWLVPGGWLILTTGDGAYEGEAENWLGSGATMFWSHADARTYRRWLAELGFEVVDQVFVPEGDGGHELFRARAR